MLIREERRLRLAVALSIALVLLLLCLRLAGPALSDVLLGSTVGHLQLDDWIYRDQGSSASIGAASPHPGPFLSSSSGPGGAGSKGEQPPLAPPNDIRPGPGGHPLLHTEVFSVSTRDRKFFRVKFGSASSAQDAVTVQPNILPHPRAEHLWLAVAQRRPVRRDDAGAAAVPRVELVCEAMFIDDVLTCIGEDGRGFGEPTHLPVAFQAVEKCATGPVAMVRPQDAKVFYGPQAPYIAYGSASTCSGQWIQDLRRLVPGGWAQKESTHDMFLSKNGTELQRPSPPYAEVKDSNWFLFWDVSGTPYVHYALHPRRSFAQLHGDGSVGRDLAPQSAEHDQQCLQQYLAPLLSSNNDNEGYHHPTIPQATNSLAITLCRRSDPSCTPDVDNTFLFALFQHKTLSLFGGQHQQHVTHDPYVVVFRQRAPFALVGVGTRPFWISGRRTFPSSGATEDLAASSISWKGKGQRYHGYEDDVVFLTFTIEGGTAGGIDVRAGELLVNLGLC